MFFDSHCHLTDERLREQVDDVLERAREADVTAAVTIASDLDDARAAVGLAERHDALWATAGIHPHTAGAAPDGWTEELHALLEHERVVALGETGLDYYYDNAPRARQRQLFTRHLELAADTGVPVVVHARAADQDVAAAIRDAGEDVRGVLHCFASGTALLDAGLEAGWFVSFSGLVSFRNYEDHDLVRAVPAERLLIETDSPYLAPVPKRGRTNEPAWVVHVAEAVAALRDQTVEEVARITSGNARRFYGLDAAPAGAVG